MPSERLNAKDRKTAWQCIQPLFLDVYGNLFPGQEAQAIAMKGHRFSYPSQPRGTGTTGTILEPLARELVPIRAKLCESGEGASVATEKSSAEKTT